MHSCKEPSLWPLLSIQLYRNVNIIPHTRVSGVTESAELRGTRQRETPIRYLGMMNSTQKYRMNFLRD